MLHFRIGEPGITDLLPRGRDCYHRVVVVAQRRRVSHCSGYHCVRTSCLHRTCRVEQQTWRLS